MTTNPEIDQDRVADLVETFDRYGYVMFPQQRAIYERIAQELRGSTLEAGCGNGVGSAILLRRLDVYDVGGSFTATDKSDKNVAFAKCLYPWIDFGLWDINHPWLAKKYAEVVAVECFEHVVNPQAAMRNLMAAATRRVWISTPNGNGKPRPPENPHHVAEYTPREMMDFVFHAADRNTTVCVRHWETWELITDETATDPNTLVYEIQLP